MARTVIRDYSPDIVIASSDWHSVFEMYLMRFAKDIGALRVTFQDTAANETGKIGIWFDLIKSHYYLSNINLPLKIRLFYVKLRKYIGHILYYWVLPLLNGESPFWGKQSYILNKGHSGSRDSNYHVVLSERDYKMHKRSGVPSDKLYILSHPITRSAKQIFSKLISSENNGFCKKKSNIIAAMLPAEDFGFKKKDYSLIGKKERIKVQAEIFKTLLTILDSWEIVVKPHPMTKNYLEKKHRIESISSCIEVVDPSESADKYIKLCDIMVHLPLPVSTTLFSASLQCPRKPILALDLHNEFMGDWYKDFNGVEYINSIDRFTSVLEKIRDNKYTKETYETDEPNVNRFSDTIEILEYFIEKKSRAMPIIN